MDEITEEKLAASVSELAEQCKQLRSAVNSIDKRLEKVAAQLEQTRFSVASSMQEEYFHRVAANQLGYVETVELVAEKRLSLSRFGDGEFGLLTDPYRSISFQRGSIELARELRTVLSTHRPSLLVALPGLTSDTYWMTSMARCWPVLNDVLPHDRQWGIASVSRAGAFNTERERLVNAWRSCWDGQTATVVFGKGSRFELIDELFDNVTADFVYAPPRNAYESLDSIEEEVLAKGNKIVLLALGPAATVLAARLADKGVQAIDIGHISASYKQAFQGGPVPETMPVSS